MTAPRQPRRPEKRPSEGAAKASRKPARKRSRRRLKYVLQDARHSLKKAGRKVADPVRDAAARAKRAEGPPRKAKGGTQTGRTKGGAETGRAKPAGSSSSGSTASASRRGRGSRPKAAKPASSSVSRRAGRAPSTGRSRLRRRPRRGKGERRRAPRARRPRQPVRAGAAGLATRVTAFGDRASRLIRSAAAPGVAALLAAVALARKGIARLSAAVTPLRGVVAVTGLAAILLAVSQFVDYRGVAVGAGDYAAYSDVEVVAPAPQVDRQPAGSAHAYLLLPVALAALVLLVGCVRGRWQLGRVISVLGLAAIAVSLLVDMPAGLDAGEQSIAYASVEAKLIEGFYAQVFAAAVLVAGGLLVSHYAKRSARRRAPRRRTAGSRALRARAA